MSIQKQQRLLKSQPDIIVGTPGRLWALKESVFWIKIWYLSAIPSTIFY